MIAPTTYDVSVELFSNINNRVSTEVEGVSTISVPTESQLRLFESASAVDLRRNDRPIAIDALPLRLFIILKSGEVALNHVQIAILCSSIIKDVLGSVGQLQSMSELQLMIVQPTRSDTPQTA